MRLAIKLLISLCIIGICTQIGRKFPSLAGLIAVMPLTGALVLIWLYIDNPNNFEVMVDYTKGAVWGIVPSVLFFFIAFLCFRKQFSLWLVLTASFGIWFVGACVHQWLLK